MDDEAAAVVRHIFDICMEGRGPLQIAKQLREEKILPPTAYILKEGRKTPHAATADPYHWDQMTVAGILEHREYTGCTVSFNTYSNSTWEKKPHKNPVDQQAIFYNITARPGRTDPICFPAWSTAPTADPRCNTALPATFRNARITSSTQPTAATPDYHDELALRV